MRNSSRKIIFSEKLPVKSQRKLHYSIHIMKQ